MANSSHAFWTIAVPSTGFPASKSELRRRLPSACAVVRKLDIADPETAEFVEPRSVRLGFEVDGDRCPIDVGNIYWPEVVII
jgi:hypothetical protein